MKRLGGGEPSIVSTTIFVMVMTAPIRYSHMSRLTQGVSNGWPSHPVASPLGAAVRTRISLDLSCFPERCSYFVIEFGYGRTAPKPRKRADAGRFFGGGSRGG